VDDLMADLVALKRGDIEVPPLPQTPAAENIAPTARPPEEDLLAKHGSHFNTTN